MSIRQMTAGHSEYHKSGKDRDESLMEWRTTFEGAVLQTFERNGSWDSDFIAIVWDEERQCVREVEYATTRFWTYGNSAVVDATPEVLAKAQAYAHAVNLRMAIAADQAQARRIAEGREVRILPTATGRDRRSKYAPGGVIPAGSTGYVAAIVVDPFRTPTYRYGGTVPHAHKVAIQYQGKHLIYLPDDAVEVVDPEQYESDPADIEAALPPAENYTNFHRPTPGYLNMVA